MSILGRLISFILPFLASKLMGNAAILKGIGGLLAGGGLAKILGSLQGAGMGNVVKGWIGQGPNPAISPDQLGSAVGEGPLAEMAKKIGLPTDQFKKHLAEQLPKIVDKLTPNGVLPSADEIDGNLRSASFMQRN